MDPNQEPLDIPEEVQERIKIWQKLFLRSSYAHYFFGIVGIAAASISAATDGGLSKLLAAASAVCIGVLGFAQPDRKYVKSYMHGVFYILHRCVIAIDK
jgi:hypothetical protein